MGALEGRRLLAGVVGNNLDVANGNTVSIADLIGDDGDDGISFREAILADNATAGAGRGSRVTKGRGAEKLILDGCSAFCLRT